jgi:hypothetical protein
MSFKAAHLISMRVLAYLIGANGCLLSLKPIQKVQVAFRRDRRRKLKQLVYRKHDGEELSQAKRERLTIKPIAC